jgi:hypothetical protein
MKASLAGHLTYLLPLFSVFIMVFFPWNQVDGK